MLPSVSFMNGSISVILEELYPGSVLEVDSLVFGEAVVDVSFVRLLVELYLGSVSEVDSLVFGVVVDVSSVRLLVELYLGSVSEVDSLIFGVGVVDNNSVRLVVASRSVMFPEGHKKSKIFIARFFLLKELLSMLLSPFTSIRSENILNGNRFEDSLASEENLGEPSSLFILILS